MGFREWLSTKSAQARPQPSLQRSEIRTEPNSLISQELLQEVDRCVKGHCSTDRVLFSEEMHSLRVVGESFRGEAFQFLRGKYQTQSTDEEIDVWFSGVLLPEPKNKYDVHAIMVVLIDRTEENGTLKPLHVGYIAKEDATTLQPKLIKLRNEGKVIPLLIRVNGGTISKPNFGILAKATSKAVTF